MSGTTSVIGSNVRPKRFVIQRDTASRYGT